MAEQQIQRYASVLAVKDDKIEDYKQLHADVWPGVLKMIKQCNIRNYSIYLRKLPDTKHYLFSYLEYVGDNFEKDMETMAADSETRRWWDVCMPCQEPLADRQEGEWWAATEEVFHVD